MKRKKADSSGFATAPVSHDAYFRKNFSDTNLAREYLEAFLSSELLATINLDTLQRDDTSYVNEHYKKTHSDVVYQAQLKDFAHELTISFLFEHKSRQPANIYLQLLSYILQVWQRCTLEKRPISFVIPIVVYHGRKKWRKVPLEHYFKNLPTVFRSFLPAFDYHLTDLASTPSSVLAELQNQYLLRHVLAALKFAGQQTAQEREYAMLLLQSDDPELQTRVTQTIVYLVSHLPETENKRLELILEQNQKEMTTIYQSLVNKGKAEGKLQGKLEGQTLTLEVVRQILRCPTKSDKEIATQLGIDAAFIAEVRATLK